MILKELGQLKPKYDIGEIKVFRAKEYDNGVIKGGKPIKTNHCYTPEYLTLEDM